MSDGRRGSERTPGGEREETGLGDGQSPSSDRMQPSGGSVVWRKEATCLEAWPECEPMMYDPRCCRFPKSCSCESPVPEAAGEVTERDIGVAGHSSGQGVESPSGSRQRTDTHATNSGPSDPARSVTPPAVVSPGPREALVATIREALTFARWPHRPESQTRMEALDALAALAVPVSPGEVNEPGWGNSAKVTPPGSLTSPAVSPGEVNEPVRFGSCHPRQEGGAGTIREDAPGTGSLTSPAVSPGEREQGESENPGGKQGSSSGSARGQS